MAAALQPNNQIMFEVLTKQLEIRKTQLEVISWYLMLKERSTVYSLVMIVKLSNLWSYFTNLPALEAIFPANHNEKLLSKLLLLLLLKVSPVEDGPVLLLELPQLGVDIKRASKVGLSIVISLWKYYIYIKISLPATACDRTEACPAAHWTAAWTSPGGGRTRSRSSSRPPPCSRASSSHWHWGQ